MEHRCIPVQSLWNSRCLLIFFSTQSDRAHHLPFEHTSARTCARCTKLLPHVCRRRVNTQIKPLWSSHLHSLKHDGMWNAISRPLPGHTAALNEMPLISNKSLLVTNLIYCNKAITVALIHTSMWVSTIALCQRDYITCQNDLPFHFG